MTLSRRAVVAVAVYAALYGGGTAIVWDAPYFQAGEALGVMLVFGIGFSVAAWLATARAVPAPLRVHAPARELGALGAYLVLFAVLFLVWGLSALKAAFPSEPGQSLAILVSKLVVMVAIPGWLFTRLGYTWRELLGPRSFGRGGRIALVVVGALLLGLQLTVGRGPGTIRSLEQPGWLVALLAPIALVWLILEAGLAEEFLFRALFQERAAAALRSPTAGIVAMALVFALAHAPGYVLRGAHAMEGMTRVPSALTAVAYAVVVVSPLGLMFGVLWARTRNLWLVAVLHGWGDLLPNLAPFVRAWTRH